MAAKQYARVVALSLALVPGSTPAFAQKAAFVDAFVAFHSALFGTYGDEGPEVTAALDRMASTLEAWDQTRDPAAARQFDAAIAATRSAIAAQPSRSDLHVRLGRLYEEVGRRSEATAAFEMARRISPSDPVAAYLLGLQLSEKAAADDADIGDALQPLLATLLEALDGPGLSSKQPLLQFALVDDLSASTRVFAPAAYERGFALLLQGRFREGLEAFRTSAAQDPLIGDGAARSEAFRRGVAALRQRRGGPAIEALEAAVRDFPASAEAHRVLGIVYRAAGRLPDSIVHFDAAVRLAPGDERARVGLGTTLLEAGRASDAERVLREAIARLPTSGDARWALADVYEHQDRGAEAIRVLEDSASLIVIAGKVHLYWRIAQLAHALHRDNPRVIDALTRRMRLVPNEPHAHKDLGLAYNRAGRDDEALLELLMARLLGHEDAELLTTTGQIHLNQHHLDRAEADLTRAVALDPTFAQARYALGRTLQRLGREAQAADQLRAFDRLRAAALEEQRLTFEREAGVTSPMRRPPR
jgi:tetratricopeptide (TPR) repeat protein